VKIKVCSTKFSMYFLISIANDIRWVRSLFRIRLSSKVPITCVTCTGATATLWIVGTPIRWIDAASHRIKWLIIFCTSSYAILTSVVDVIAFQPNITVIKLQMTSFILKLWSFHTSLLGANWSETPIFTSTAVTSVPWVSLGLTGTLA